MRKTSVELGVGVFVMIGLACVGYLTIKLGKMEWIGNNYYSISAQFNSATGLKTGAEVVMAGVQIGNVDAITLNQKNMKAMVQMKIRKDLKLTDDVIASVKTAGLIGDKYISISPGGSDIILNPGEMITETESPIDLEDMIRKYVFGDV